MLGTGKSKVFRFAMPLNSQNDSAQFWQSTGQRPQEFSHRGSDALRIGHELARTAAMRDEECRLAVMRAYVIFLILLPAVHYPRNGRGHAIVALAEALAGNCVLAILSTG